VKRCPTLEFRCATPLKCGSSGASAYKKMSDTFEGVGHLEKKVHFLKISTLFSN